MNQRDNLKSLFRRTGFDFIPPEFGLCPDLLAQFKMRYGDGTDYAEEFGFPWRIAGNPRMPERYVDWMKYYPGGVKRGTIIDRLWGIAKEPGSDAAKHMTHMLHPMEDFDSLEEVEAYPYPDFIGADWSNVRDNIVEMQACGLAAQATMACTVWEISWYLRGMENLMMDMLSDEDMAVAILDRSTEIACVRAKNYAECGIDILHLGDDVGMQQSIMMSLDMYRQWLKPRLARVIAAAKSVNPDVIVTYHSCGFVTPLISDFIDVGVDVLNPVQPECMDFFEIHKKFGDRLSFWGTIGTQSVMPFGNPEDVKREVWKNLDIAGEKGGLLCAPTHLLEPEVPWKNIEAYIEACREYDRAGV